MYAESDTDFQLDKYFDEESSLHRDDLTNDNFDVTLSPCMVSPTSINTNISDSTKVPYGSSDEEEFQAPKPKTLHPRKVYLITYSQADVLKIQSRKQFAELVVDQFNLNGNVVQQWVSSAEMHRQIGVHYHLAVKLNAARRFNQIRQNILKEHGINLDFGEWHDNYYSAYTYVTKFDTHYETSQDHPALSNPPQTASATSAKRAAAKERNNLAPNKKRTKESTKEYKQPRLNNETVGALIFENNIKSDKQLYAFAKKQANEGKKDLQSYLYNRPNQKHHVDLIATVWKIEESEAEIHRENKSRLLILQEAKSKPCAMGSNDQSCNRSWLHAAIETLRRNSITRNHFSKLVLNSLEHGRGKGRNLMICGPTNCAKSFMLMPLTKIFNCFMTPSQGTYNWVDAPEKEIIFLNDLRYEMHGEKTVMPWNMFLNLLEGVPVNISMPKNFFSKDCQWNKKQPIFSTADKPIIRIRNGAIDVGETQQMAERWIVINFKYQYQGEKVNYDLIPCGRCFAELILGS